MEDGRLVAHVTDHRITRVTTTKAIEQHNRIYISMRNALALTQLKARVITSTGKVTNFDEKNLKEIRDEETDNTYRIFAMEGVEIDSEIEVLYTLKIRARTQETFYFQQRTPIKEFYYELQSPKSQVFDFKVYNDNNTIVADTLNRKNRFVLRCNDIPGLREEGFGNTGANSKRIELKLLFNYDSNSRSRLNNWADAGRE